MKTQQNFDNFEMLILHRIVVKRIYAQGGIVNKVERGGE